MPDISTRADLELLLRHFYGRAFADPVLEPAFETLAVIGIDDHLPVMCDFWETILLRTGVYRGSAFAVHRALHGRHGFTDRHFDRWVELWASSVDELFAGDVAGRAKGEAAKIADAMRRRLFEPPAVRRRECLPGSADW
ncbi:group III truncated hemoglobin [Rhodococcus sp. IEGM 1307]|uniref:group III truncated hemoglobin n=1 Tax=Rhodococcus sp. IEGM 1307 TaxID=3047091 RepID=UPI0024B722E3|nr:group III truncated hemoglobin [Rhodococcus sp. IEGM 1307]MDI9978363.1 group III truncated hemoglobin [Rhodococcus sp. IEGM 1307]